MKYLLDTNVLSALRNSRKEPAVAGWARTVPTHNQFTSAICVGEIGIGIESLSRRDKPAGELIRGWLERQLLPAFASRVLPFDHECALAAARYRTPNGTLTTDAMIAATAEVNELTVATRNTKDFAGFGVPLIDPWQYGVGRCVTE